MHGGSPGTIQGWRSRFGNVFFFPVTGLVPGVRESVDTVSSPHENGPCMDACWMPSSFSGLVIYEYLVDLRWWRDWEER